MSFTQDSEYNGYTNYPTWNAMLWIDNARGTYEEIAQRIMNEAEASEYITRERRAAHDLADYLKNEFEEENVPDEASMMADMINWVSSKINWVEIADHLLENVEPEDDEEDVEEIGEGDPCPHCGDDLKADDQGLYCSRNNCDFELGWED